MTDSVLGILLQHFATSWTAACQASLSFTIPESFLKIMSIELVMPSNHLILFHPLLLLPLIFPGIGFFSALHIRWLKYWSFSFSISPSNEYSGLMSFKIDWLISLLSKRLWRVFSSTTVQKHQFFSALPSSRSSSHIHTWLMERPSLDYMDLCWQSDVSAISRFVIAFLPRRNHFLISQLQLFAVYITQLVKNPLAMQETPVWFLGLEDLLEKGQAIHSNILGLALWLNW